MHRDYYVVPINRCSLLPSSSILVHLNINLLNLSEVLLVYLGLKKQNIAEQFYIGQNKTNLYIQLYVNKKYF